MANTRKTRVGLVIDEQRQPHVLFCALPHLSTLDQCVRANLAQHKLQRRKHYFVAAISPHQIWSKTILFPHPLSESECEAQCGLLLTQELPIALSQLWFDYCAEQRQQGFRLTVFALQRSIAEQYLAPLSHVDVRVLDNVVYALLRAFQFLLPDTNYLKTLLLYQDTQGCIAMQKRDHQVVYIQQAMADLNSTYTQILPTLSDRDRVCGCVSNRKNKRATSNRLDDVTNRSPFDRTRECFMAWKK